MAEKYLDEEMNQLAANVINFLFISESLFYSFLRHSDDKKPGSNF